MLPLTALHRPISRGSGVQEDGLHGEMEGTSGGLPHRGTLRGSSRARLPAEHPEFESGVHTPQVLYRNRFRYNGSKGAPLFFSPFPPVPLTDPSARWRPRRPAL